MELSSNPRRKLWATGNEVTSLSLGLRVCPRVCPWVCLLEVLWLGRFQVTGEEPDWPSYIHTHTHTQTFIHTQQVISTWLVCFYATWWNIEETEEEEQCECVCVCVLNFTVSFITNVMKSEAKCLTQLWPVIRMHTHTRWEQWTNTQTHALLSFMLPPITGLSPVQHLCCCDARVLICTWTRLVGVHVRVCVCVCALVVSLRFRAYQGSGSLCRV